MAEEFCLSPGMCLSLKESKRQISALLQNDERRVVTIIMTAATASRRQRNPRSSMLRHRRLTLMIHNNLYVRKKTANIQANSISTVLTSLTNSLTCGRKDAVVQVAVEKELRIFRPMKKAAHGIPLHTYMKVNVGYSL